MRDGPTPPPGQPQRPSHDGRNGGPADPDVNPLSRPCDRTRTRWHVGLALAVLIALICGVIAGARMWSDAARTAHDEAAHRHETTLARATGAATSARDGTPPVLVDASWHAPDGTPRTGKVAVQSRTAEGTTLTIWVDDAGAVTRAPRSTAEGQLAAAVGGTFIAGALALTAAGVVGLRLRRAEAAALDAWESEWAVVEPLWTHRGRT
ncbi:Rv1733c family protein [Streptomyces sp. bgisy060]|uniref:Rv1733c family protein n=1 Tax=Streptomyces sp. bgisy060 TaxID=3413775 RepID=UPI003EBE43CE